MSAVAEKLLLSKSDYEPGTSNDDSFLFIVPETPLTGARGVSKTSRLNKHEFRPYYEFREEVERTMINGYYPDWMAEKYSWAALAGVLLYEEQRGIDTGLRAVNLKPPLSPEQRRYLFESAGDYVPDLVKVMVGEMVKNKEKG